MNPLEKQLWMMPAKPDGALENALAGVAEREGAISVRKLYQLMQESTDSAAKEIKQRSFAQKNVCNDATDYVIPDATGLVCVVARPIALTERRPDEAEKSENGECYYGCWDRGGTWEWVFVNMRPSWATHFLPAGVEVLPATCFNPTEE